MQKKTLHALVEEYLVALEHERPAILDRINTELLEVHTLKSVRDSLTVDQSFMRAYAEFRRKLRTLLWEHGNPNNLGWTDEEIVQAFRQLLKDKQERK